MIVEKEKNNWDMKKCLDKLNELQNKYPELIRARMLVVHVMAITNVWEKDDEIERHFKELEFILSHPNEVL